LATLAVCLLAGWFFGGLVFQDRVPAAGDFPAFYQPLLRYTQAQWSAGRLPLWNPYENLGQPLVAGGTSSVFYPGKLLFFLPIGWERCCAWYLALHVVLAAAGAFRLARHWQCSRTAAGLAGLSYAFGGQVVYQYSNMVFLVGAAWLPLALEAADRMLRGRSLAAAAGLAVVLALMVLGGDPQMAYHAGLIAAVEAFWLGRHDRAAPLLWPVSDRATSPTAGLPDGGRPPVGPFGGVGRPAPNGGATSPTGSGPRRVAAFFGHRFVLLAVAAGGAAALAAIQILPSAELAGRSDRTITDTARSLYEIPAALRHDDRLSRIARGFAAQTSPGTYYEHVFDYSVAPWRLPELLWPNVSGRPWPIDRRWLDKLDGEGRLWTPSLYLGLLPLLLALLRLRFRRTAAGAALDRGLSWLALLALLASLGGYGLGWLVHHVMPHTGRAGQLAGSLGGPLGGLYWLMTYVLPGYLQFRYPGKLFTLAALALVMLAARGWDAMATADDQRAGPERLRRLAAWLGAITLTGVMAALAVRPWWPRFFDAGDNASPLFGPWDAIGAINDVTFALAQTAVLCGGVWLLAWKGIRKGISPIIAHDGKKVAKTRGDNGTYPPLLSCAVLLITALDLGLANGWLVATVPGELVRRPPRLAEAVRAAAGQPGPSPPRIHRQEFWTPGRWQTTASADRWNEIVAWDHDTLFQNHPFTAGLASTELWGTLMTADYNAWLAAAGERATPALAEVLLGEGLAEPKHSRPVPLPREQGRPAVEDVSLWRNEKALPRAWIAHDFLRLSPIDPDDDEALLGRSHMVLFDHGKPRDLVGRPLVEAGPDSGLPPNEDRPAAGDAAPQHGETWRIIHYEPSRVEIDAKLAAPGLVVLADQFFPGWRLEVTTAGQAPRELPILRTDRLLRGCWLPAGHHRLVYRYRPASFFWGAALSAAAWAGLGLWLSLAVAIRCKGGTR